MPQRSITASYYRGGTSRALIFQPQNLPVDRSSWPPIFLQLMGSPDPYGRQLDGMGAGVSSLSKICIIAPSTREDADVDYTFVGIGIERDEVDMAGNCGNMSSAVGPYAVNEGMVEVGGEGEKEVTVRVHNTNTGVVIRSTFPVVDGQAAVEGQYAIDGVAGTGAKIRLDFSRPGGAKTGKLLPTGKVVQRIKGVEVSCVDATNPCIFVRAEDVGLPGTILPNDFNKLPEKLALLDEIRREGAVTMGLVKTESEVPRTIPKIGIVSRPATHRVLSGEAVEEETVDVVLRFISDEQPHRAIPLTAALCTAVASKIKGSIVEQCLTSKPVNDGMATIGHASGRIQVDATMDEKGEAECATVFRTARRIFDGKVYYNA
jgi:2-methylaconitate cis-trans-isomerase PrpF